MCQVTFRSELFFFTASCMTSSNQAVTQNLTYSGGVSGLALGVDALGTTTLTFTWLDTTGATQTSTLTLNVVTP